MVGAFNRHVVDDGSMEIGVSVERILVALWCGSIGVLSFLVVPNIQGTVPAYLFGFLSIPVCLIFLRFEDAGKFNSYLRDWLYLGLAWFGFFSISQLLHYFDGYKVIVGFDYISGENSMLLRRSMFTQSLYLLACFATFTFFRHWPGTIVERFVFTAAWVLAIYGIYEWFYFLLTGSTGDFVVNRNFDGEHTASWSQLISVGGLQLLRIKSTLGEPSFFAGMSVPFLFAAYCTRRYVLASLLLFCIVFTFSSSAYGGVAVGLVALLLFYSESRIVTVSLFAAAGVSMLCLIVFLPELFENMVLDKFQGLNDSGAIRLNLEERRAAAVESLSLGHHLFGLGFGYVYDSVFNSIRYNLGYVGAALFAIFFVYPFFYCLARRCFSVWGFACLVVLGLYIINVAELFLPSTWVFLALAWRDLDKVSIDVKESETLENDSGEVLES